MRELTLAVTRAGDHTVIAVHGDLDSSNHQQLDTLLAEQATDSTQVIVDFSGLTFLDTQGITTLLEHWQRLANGGGSMVIAGATYTNARALWITGLASRLPLADDVESARAVTIA